jgi:2-dehydro-3-deoxyphosphogalactonate aldolase
MTAETHLDRLPLIAILRGVTPETVVAIAGEILAAGFTTLEVPTNSPDVFESIRRLVSTFGDRALIGAGTVLTETHLAGLVAAGGRLVVMPHSDPAIVRAAKAAGLVCLPGVATPTEGFAALANGADGLKLFPAEQFPPAVVKAWRAVFSADISLMPVGGVTPDNMSDYLSAGASGFGLGSALYKPRMTASDVGERARSFVAAWRRERP